MVCEKNRKEYSDVPVFVMLGLSLFLLLIAIIKKQNIYNYAAIVLAGISGLFLINYRKNKTKLELVVCLITFMFAGIFLAFYLLDI